ncbi:ADP-heptose:LPS heptosyltransferase [Noviherbaspirillum humi]|uniref:ADP-heptose:LPS heptosyltransferase n=1 Tax=Noviherbaspirillum humi TaxID=1688639 RepID=A0A239J239_9BURK|nr:glycosyltransferase family 9 protein [Noviherbaspirillum humi]SNS99333.1 ADP-heptose:LPS heptosyltransferase [Noviherbaspirillum humi]
MAIDFDSLRRIAVFRALQLGDLLVTVPALRALRAAAPQAQIVLVGLPWAASFAERFEKYVDEHLVFPGFPGLPESAPDMAAIPRFFAQAQSYQFDLAIQLHGSGLQTNPLAVAMGARRNAGFFVPGHYCPDPELFADWQDSEHEVLRYLRLMRFLGIETRGEALEFPLTGRDFQSLRHGAAMADIDLPAPGGYACIHPGSRLPSRRWPPERFAQVADALAAEGLQIVLTGSDGERDIIAAVRAAMHAPALDLCGRTDLGALAALVAQARLVVCNDTGISHVAAGVATPSVVISSGADARRWAPLDANRHRLLFAHAPCRPCAHVVCPVAGHPCATDVSAERVIAEALDLCAADLPRPVRAVNADLQAAPMPLRFIQDIRRLES